MLVVELPKGAPEWISNADIWKKPARLAQWEERYRDMVEAVGSSPTVGICAEETQPGRLQNRFRP